MIDCGEGGTVLRFLALRASREKGRHKLTGGARLINRPQEELVKILSQLGVTAKFEKKFARHRIRRMAPAEPYSSRSVTSFEPVCVGGFVERLGASIPST
jgi:5-enolpyruvylshikimate-3-phosphate synthase